MALFSDERFSDDALVGYMSGASVAVACMALEALSRRDGTPERVVAPILETFTRVHYWTAYFALRVLAKRAQKPVIGAVLARIDDGWPTPLSMAMLREFITLRLAGGETPTFAGELDQLNEYRATTLAALVPQLSDVLPEPLQAEVSDWSGARVDTGLLRGIGRVWDHADVDSGNVLPSAQIDEALAQLETALRSSPPRPTVLVGEAGVGKTTALRALADRLQRDGWTIFEAGASDLLAGQVFVGQLEGRVQMLLRSIEHRKVLWLVPHFHELLWAGRSQQSPTAALDHLLASMESGAVHLVGELTPAAYQRILQAKPQLRSLLTPVQLHPASDEDTMELGRRWVAARSAANAAPLMEEHVLHEAAHVVKQYLSDKAAPGNLLHFLTATYRRLAASGDTAPLSVTLDDLLVTLSQLTGLPLRILDERETVDLHGLRTHFNRRVIGQPEAIDCLVGRVAMIKAGVNDPDRPIGVFLFVGPTGTGKTEIAKTFAQYLFGSPDRMIRLDMSELQAAESLDRILGTVYEGTDGTALVNAIRRQPFSVLLLDEFEKAHPNVWDLFLQVFDDGRLTDRRGDVADFRHAVIIMTSNLGARLPYGATIGFVPGDTGFAPRSVERAVGETFRREFVNRIDRIVVFRPLGRPEMREILHKELDDVLRRRGLRTRNWAVEWDVSAIDFLLEKGFTPDLGARPLRRAVERYVLAPLATAIVNREVPEGDQFLLVRADGDRLDATFIDPDAPEDEAAAPPTAEPGTDLDLRALVADPAGTREEVEFLEDRFDDITQVVGAPEWQATKDATLAKLRADGFWDSPERFGVLGLAEFMDRLEVGLDTAGSLLRRLSGQAGEERRHYSRDLVQRVAQQLYLVGAARDALAAGAPRDAYIMISAVRDRAADGDQADAFARRVADMYREWARRRRMRLATLEETPPGEAAPYRAVFAVTGFGAHSILAPEAGLHVMESPQDEKSFDRVKARVVVAPQGDAPAPDAKTERAQARELLDSAADASAQTIVRRYREEPSPLVRDSVRGWRTGRIDRVFAGDFDVLA